MFFSAMPVPRAMARSGSSAIWNGSPVFSRKTSVEALDKGAAAGQVDAVLDDVGIEFGRHRFEHLHQRGVEFDERFFECVGDFVVVERDALRQCRQHVGAGDGEILRLFLQLGYGGHRWRI